MVRSMLSQMQVKGSSVSALKRMPIRMILGEALSLEPLLAQKPRPRCFFASRKLEKPALNRNSWHSGRADNLAAVKAAVNQHSLPYVPWLATGASVSPQHHNLTMPLL